MTSDDTSPEQTQQRVIDRASSDSDFRAQLLQNPHEALQQELGVSLPATITIRVIEEQPGEVVLVLPTQTQRSGARLSQAELEGVAGGTSVGGIASWYCGGCTGNG